jgi:hypothetical protein
MLSAGAPPEGDQLVRMRRDHPFDRT